MSIILAIDPGPRESGFVLYDARNRAVLNSGVGLTRDMLQLVRFQDAIVAIEMIASYGMAVGREVFETCVWIGRLQQSAAKPEDVRLVYRKDVKLHLCGTPRAKDANIRQALIDRLGPQGTKKAAGPTYGVKSHAWAALAVAVTVADSIEKAKWVAGYREIIAA
jgi:hypothetical protein